MLFPTTSVSAPPLPPDYQPAVREFVPVIQYEEPIIIEQVKQPEPSSEVLCNCYSFVREYYHDDLPETSVILTNLTSEISDVAVFYYANSGLYHYAKVIWNDGFNFEIDEANFSHCQNSQRKLTVEYPSLIGFYTAK